MTTAQMIGFLKECQVPFFLDHDLFLRVSNEEHRGNIILKIFEIDGEKPGFKITFKNRDYPQVTCFCRFDVYYCNTDCGAGLGNIRQYRISVQYIAEFRAMIDSAVEKLQNQEE